MPEVLSPGWRVIIIIIIIIIIITLSSSRLESVRYQVGFSPHLLMFLADSVSKGLSGPMGGSFPFSFLFSLSFSPDVSVFSRA